MLKKILYPCTFLLGALIFVSCEEESNAKFDAQSFTHIYDDPNFDASYIPVDIAQTPDGGYLVLCAQRLDGSNFTSIYLLKVDKFGNFVKELDGGSDYLNPVAKFTQVGNNYYFFCMDPSTQAFLASVDTELTALTTTALSVPLTYPAVSTYNATDNFILQSYNTESNESVISTISTTGNVAKTKGYSIGVGDDEIEEPIINHFIRTGRKLPFEVGKLTTGQYFFTGFYNYTFALVFTDINSDDPLGVVNGTQDDGGYSAIVPINANKFATSSFNFGDNYFLPNETINTAGDTMKFGFNLPELVPNAKVKIHRATINAKNVLIYASDTKSKQIGLFFYDEATGVFLSSRYLGFANPFEIASVISTVDGGIAVCGTTYLAGRFPRVCIFKLSEKEITSNAK